MTQIQHENAKTGNTIVCRECGSVNYEGDKYCAVCGARLDTDFQFEEPHQSVHVEQRSTRTRNSGGPQVVTNRYDGFTIAGFVLAIISLCGGAFFIVPPVLGIIFSHMGINNTKKDGTKGYNLARAGFVISIVSLAVTLALYLLLGVFD